MACPPTRPRSCCLRLPLIVANRGPRDQILTASEYRKLAPCLASLQSQPGDLLEPGAGRLVAQCGEVIDEARLRALLDRGFLLSQAVERWQTRGIWVVSRADAAYPPLLKKRLKNDAPSVLYGCGPQAIMHTRSLAIVGSRRRYGTTHRLHAGNCRAGRRRRIDRGFGWCERRRSGRHERCFGGRWHRRRSVAGRPGTDGDES